MKQNIQLAFVIIVLILGSSDSIGSSISSIYLINPHQIQANCLKQIIKTSSKSSKEEADFYRALLSNGQYKICELLRIIEFSIK